MRKKSILLFIMIFSLWSSVAFAEEIDDNRWFWISSNEKFSTYVDTQTIKYHPEIDMCDMWIKFDSQPEGKYIVEHINLSFKNNIINVYDYIEYSYDKANPVTNTLNLNGRSFTIAPDTVSEDLKQKAAELVGRDEKLAEYNKQQQDIKEQKKKEEQEQAEQKEKAIEEQKKAHEEAVKKAERKANVNAAIGILGSLF